MIVRVAGPARMLGLYAVLSHGVYEVSAESLTSAQLRPVERERFLNFLRSHKEAQMRAVQCICQEYRFALQDACRISLAETVAGRLGTPAARAGSPDRRTRRRQTAFRFPLLLTHEEMASMACTTRETVTRTLGQFRKDGWISIEDVHRHRATSRSICRRWHRRRDLLSSPLFRPLFRLHLPFPRFPSQRDMISIALTFSFGVS